MTIELRDNKIKYLQTIYSAFLNKYVKKVNYGVCPESLTQKVMTIPFLIDIWYRYEAFLQEVTNARLIRITRTNEESVKISVIVNFTTIGSYSGVGTEEEIVAALAATINLGTAIHSYIALYSGTELYIYTYDNTETYANIASFSIDVGEITITEESLENNLDVILDLQNCISLCDMMDLFKFTKNLILN